MVKTTQQDSVGDVGLAVIGVPFLAVVGLGAPGWSIASRPYASSVTYLENGALSAVEQAALTTKIEHIPAPVGVNLDGAGVAEVRLDNGKRNSVDAPLEVPDAEGDSLGSVVIAGDHDADGGPVRAQRGRCIHLGAAAQDIHDRVERQLLIAARIGRELVRPAAIIF